MRTLAIGDIHGCRRALDALLERVAPGPEDLLITLGDYVDRGPDSRGVLDRLLELHAAGRLVALRGNHEEMLCDARSSRETFHLWLECGGRQTLRSYGIEQPTQADLERLPDAHWVFLRHVCRNWYETETHIFVHANVYSDIPLAEQPADVLLWEKLYLAVPHMSGKVMVCGHTRQPTGLPRNLGFAVCIDTGAYTADGWLTCLDTTTGRIWQANQLGETREVRLGEPEEDEGLF
jgi:serine/threonine protein phosphatase 1